MPTCTQYLAKKLVKPLITQNDHFPGNNFPGITSQFAMHF